MTVGYKTLIWIIKMIDLKNRALFFQKPKEMNNEDVYRAFYNIFIF